MRISEWSSDVCSSDLLRRRTPFHSSYLSRTTVTGVAETPFLLLRLLAADAANQGSPRAEGMRVMTQHGKVSDYNDTTGTGFIAPEKGGGPLPFRWADLQDKAQLPKQNDSYG